MQIDSNETGLKGNLLVAMPGIGDDRFKHSVILICAHEADYAMGIVVNNPVDHITVPDILSQLDVPLEADIKLTQVLDGGPVGNDRGFVLHSSDFHSVGATMDVTENCHLTATKDILFALASSSPPEQAMLALGYAGWGAGQLDIELKENAWLVGHADHDIVFGTDHSTKWDHAMDLMGVNSGMFQHQPGRA